MSSLMQLRHVGYRTPDKVILTDINWTIPAGAELTVTGPSGSGKSTLLRIMASMISKTSGDLLFAEKPLESYDPIAYRRQVSYCFQQPTLFGETVADNLNFPYQIRRQTPNHDHIVEALTKAGLAADMLDQAVDDLSGGERQRVALIRNILFLPRILLLDEVTAGLDDANKASIHRWLHHLNVDHQLTTIMITHDSAEIHAAPHLVHVTQGRLEVAQ